MLAGIQQWVHVEFFVVLHYFSWNVSSLDTKTLREHLGKKTYLMKLPWYCNFPFLHYYDMFFFNIKETDINLNENRHLMMEICHLVYLTTHKWRAITFQETNTHQSLLHNENSSLSAAKKGGGEKGSFAVTAWRAARTVFATAHVLTWVLTATQEERAEVRSCFYHFKRS